jgi:hypothetical protein
MARQLRPLVGRCSAALLRGCSTDGEEEPIQCPAAYLQPGLEVHSSCKMAMSVHRGKQQVNWK